MKTVKVCHSRRFPASRSAENWRGRPLWREHCRSESNGDREVSQPRKILRGSDKQSAIPRANQPHSRPNRENVSDSRDSLSTVNFRGIRRSVRRLRLLNSRTSANTNR